MEPYTNTFKVIEADIDTLNHVNNIAYLKWVQDISAAHWYKIAPPSISDNYYWVVVRHEIDYRQAAYLDDEITAVTWVGESDGVKSDRFVHFYSRDKLITRAKTTWCLMDKQNNRPAKITDEIITILEPFKM